MTTALFFQIYICTMIVMTPIDELWNYNNPRPYPRNEYRLLNWTKGDFKTVDGKLVLMKKHMYDTPIKAKARRKYWNRLEHFMVKK